MGKRFKSWKMPELVENKPNEYNWIIHYKDNFTLGKETDIGAFTYINASNRVVIEDYVQIGSHCSIYSASTIDNNRGPVILMKNCRIGTHSVVMPGVTIGENSIVGAFSFVKEDIPPNVLCFGVPARVVRNLSKEELDEILKYCQD